MAYIQVEEQVPGIRSLVLFRPETGKYLYQLVQLLLRGNNSLSEAERELIAAYVSHRNGCIFCTNSHAAAARCLYGSEAFIVDEILINGTFTCISNKLKFLLQIAGKVQLSGQKVLSDDIDAAKNAGASDSEIHDTVLIAATFSMFNRYVDGLASFTPNDDAIYTEMGERMAEKGYQLPEQPKK